MKFKKGQKIRLKKYPEQEGVVTAVRKNMLWCRLVENGLSFAFCEPGNAELVE